MGQKSSEEDRKKKQHFRGEIAVILMLMTKLTLKEGWILSNCFCVLVKIGYWHRSLQLEGS